MKSHAIRKSLKINENLTNAVQNTKSIEEIRAERQKAAEESLEEALFDFLNNHCRSTEEFKLIDEIDMYGDTIVIDGKVQQILQNVVEYDFGRFLDAVTLLVKKYQPNYLSDREEVVFGFESRKKSIYGKNRIFIEISPRGTKEATKSNLTDQEVKDFFDKSYTCRYWLLKLTYFFLEKRVGFSTENIKKAAWDLYHNPSDFIKG